LEFRRVLFRSYNAGPTGGTTKCAATRRSMRCWKEKRPQASSRDVRSRAYLESHPKRPERNDDDRFQINRASIFECRKKVPLQERLTSILVQSVVDPAQHAHISHRPIAADH